MHDDEEVGGDPPAGGRSLRRSQQRDLGRRQLLDAAEEVFGRKGFHDTTLKEIAELAEFSVGSVYSFFTGKDDLFAEIFVRRGGELVTEMEAVLSDDAAPSAQLHALVDVQIGFFRRHPSFARLALRYANVTRIAATSDDAPAGGAGPAHYERAMELETDLFARGQACGVFVGGPPEALGRLFSGLVLSFQAFDAASDAYSLDEFRAVVERAFMG